MSVIEVKKDHWINFSSVSSFSIVGKELIFMVGTSGSKISMSDAEIKTFREKIQSLYQQDSIKRKNIRSENEPPKTHIIADHVAQLEDIAGIHFDDEDEAIYIVYKKDPKYAQLENRGKYVVRLAITEDFSVDELDKLNKAWSTYLNYYD